MTEQKEIYKCAICGNTVRVIGKGKGQLVCCGQPMDRLVENSTDGAMEKHVPVVEQIPGGYKVSIGAVAHPMIEEHHITWVGLRTEDGIEHEKFLVANDKPEMVVKTSAKAIKAGEYCNIHGLWVKKV
jgi:superoxide reductase